MTRRIRKHKRIDTMVHTFWETNEWKIQSAVFQLLVVAVLWCVYGVFGACPLVCECKWKSGKESVVCLNANLTSIPTQLDAGTQVLDLTGNQLLGIGRDAFHKADLLNLQKIFVSRCKLKTLDRYAFRKLKNLVELDLSYNLLSSVPSHIFDSISELRELKLSGNPIQRLSNEAFANIPQLVRLEISDCRIGTIEPRAFTGLEHTLEWLKLDSNKLIDVKSTTLTSLHSLHGLELAGNPWNCSCGLRLLREWMLRQNIPLSVQPVCKIPLRLSGKSWDKLTLDDFACAPTIAATKDTMSGAESSNVTLSCKITGSPQPGVKWMFRNRQLANITSGVTNSAKKLYIMKIVNLVSKLTIMTLDVQDSGVYFCVAENNAGKVEANITLSVQKRAIETGISWKILIASIIVAVLFVVASCLLVICLCTVRQKQATQRNSARQESYEKIELNHKDPTILLNQSGIHRTTTNHYTEVAVVGPVKQHPRHSEYRGIPADDGDGDDEDETPSTVVSDTRDNLAELSRVNASKALRGFYNDIPVQHHVLRKEILPTGSLYTTATQEDSRNYPDLLEASPQPDTPNFFSSTLPRIRTSRYPAVSDSQSPLLAGSRYGSSGGDSGGSRRLSAESRSSSYYKLSSTIGDHRSSSSLNLASPSVCSISGGANTGLGGTRNLAWRHPSLPTSPVREYRQAVRTVGPVTETPILDLLESRPKDYSPGALASTTYDYHAAQLERFLEEYRSLQEQLSKMKQTCESIRQHELPSGTPESVARLLEPLLTGANDESAGPKSILKNKGSASSPDTNDAFWLHNNTNISQYNKFSSSRSSDIFQS